MNESEKLQKNIRQGKLGTVLILSAALAIVACVLLYLLTGLLPSKIRRIDLTTYGLTDLSEETEKYLKNVDQKVRICLVSVAGQEDTTISGFLERVGELSDKITVETVDPAVHPAFIANYSDTDLADNSLIFISDKRFKIVKSYDLYQYSVYDAASEKTLGVYGYSDFYTLLTNYAAYFSAGYYTYEQLFCGESAVASAVDYVTTDDLPVVYSLRGHGESPLPDGILSAMSMDNLERKDLVLSAAGSVPADADCILIHAPASDLSDSERALISDYLERGGNLFLITDYRAADLPNLSALLAEYGLSGGRGYLYEAESDSYISYDDLILAKCDSAASYLGLGAYTALFTDAHPIFFSEDTDEIPEGKPVSYVSLFQTSENGHYHPLAGDEDRDSGSDANDPTGRYHMGVLASSGSAHIAWISSSYFLNPDYNSIAAGGNYVYFLALLEKISGKGDSLAIASKAMVEDSLVINGGQAIFWTVILTAMIPVCLLCAGIVVTVRRRRT